LEGANVVSTALEAGADLEALYVAPGAEAACPELLALASARGLEVLRLASGVLERVSDTVTPQPVLAVARRRPPILGELAGADLVVVGVDVRDPGNAGTLVRSAEAAGAQGVVFCRGSVDVTNPKTVRASAGALFHVPVVEGGDPQEVLGVLGDLGLVRMGASARGGVAPDQADLTRPVALVFGNEAHGLPADLRGVLDGHLTIPMPGRTESLNLGMAAAILLYEAYRQRRPRETGVAPDVR
ncbi:MAG: TrmH family RNA methyltransferase, partial [Acidimicrobiia bacterium]